MRNKKNAKKRLLLETDDRDKYSTNEGLLQSYRQIFIESEAFLLTAGVLAFEKYFPVFITIVFCGFITILIWFPVVFSRHHIVDYYKFSVGKRTTFSEDDYVHPRKRKNTTRKEINKFVGGKLGEKGNLRKTRIKLDIIIPLSFFATWLVLLFSYRAPENVTTLLSVEISQGDSVLQIISMFFLKTISFLK